LSFPVTSGVSDGCTHTHTHTHLSQQSNKPDRTRSYQAYPIYSSRPRSRHKHRRRALQNRRCKRRHGRRHGRRAGRRAGRCAGRRAGGHAGGHAGVGDCRRAGAGCTAEPGNTSRKVDAHLGSLCPFGCRLLLRRRLLFGCCFGRFLSRLLGDRLDDLFHRRLRRDNLFGGRCRLLHDHIRQWDLPNLDGDPDMG